MVSASRSHTPATASTPASVPRSATRGTNLDAGKCRDEVFEPVAATAYDHEVVALAAEPPGKSLADAGRSTGDKRQPRATIRAAGRHASRFGLF